MAGILKSLVTRLQLLEPARDLRQAAKLARYRFGWAFKRRFGRHDRLLTQEYLRTHSTRALYLGAGNHLLDGWLNSDLYPPSRKSIHLDATKPFPLENDLFNYIFSNHMIEHLSYAGGVRMLRECLRVLEPGGTLRVSTPDFAFLLDIYANPSKPIAARYIDWQLDWINRNDLDTAPSREPVFVINNFVRDWGHEFIYDKTVLRDAMVSAGFDHVVRCEFNQSKHELLQNIEHEERAPEGFVRLETMTLEGRKPPLTNPGLHGKR